jgi:hypothetical protein
MNDASTWRFAFFAAPQHFDYRPLQELAIGFTAALQLLKRE